MPKRIKRDTRIAMTLSTAERDLIVERTLIDPEMEQRLRRAQASGSKLVHGRSPADADLQRYFRVSPPVVHQMILTLEARGLIERSPGQARSIRLRVARARCSRHFGIRRTSNASLMEARSCGRTGPTSPRRRYTTLQAASSGPTGACGRRRRVGHRAGSRAAQRAFAAEAQSLAGANRTAGAARWVWSPSAGSPVVDLRYVQR